MDGNEGVHLKFPHWANKKGIFKAMDSLEFIFELTMKDLFFAAMMMIIIISRLTSQLIFCFFFPKTKHRRLLSFFSMKKIVIALVHWFYILELKVHSSEHVETVELTSHILYRYVNQLDFNSLSYSFASSCCAFVYMFGHTPTHLHYLYLASFSRFTCS